MSAASGKSLRSDRYVVSFSVAGRGARVVGMNGPAHPNDNRILKELTAAASRRLRPTLSRVLLTAGTTLSEAGDLMRHVYFLTDAVIALVRVLSDGTLLQVGMIGNEGESGVGLVMGRESLTTLAVVQIGGFAYRMPAAVLQEEMHRHGSICRLLLRHTQALFTQASMFAVCNRYHSIDQQLCRWLLLTLDRMSENHFRSTQEQIANLLGVRREGVTVAAGRLQESGAIRYRHGRITILDRRKLEQVCCECYFVVRRETDRLLPIDSASTMHDLQPLSRPEALVQSQQRAQVITQGIPGA